MVFSSITFLFFFLPAVLLLYFFSGKYRNTLLLIASLLFYTWGEGIYLLVMLISIATNYTCGRLMFYNGKLKDNARIILLGALFVNFGLLFFFKYANFITDNLNIFLNLTHLPNIEIGIVHLPIGISFFTFQAVSYLIDIYRGEVKPQKNIINLSLYISLFPQLIAGPIVRYRDIAATLSKRNFNSENVSEGVRRFLYGLSKKVLLANPLALTADKIFSLPVSDLTTPVAWLGAICYTLQIYFDFSGYSDMAIGLGRIFGFRFLENFNYPYISKSIQEFWQRWHISLSTWFRDYLYIPLGGNRLGQIRTATNLFIVFVLCGLWHGASWTFVCWGLYHGLFLVLERTNYAVFLKRLWAPLRHVVVLNIIIIGWVLFRSETISDAASYIYTMFSFYDLGNWQLMYIYLDKKLNFELIAAVILSMPVIPAVKQLYRHFINLQRNRVAIITVELLFETIRLSVLATLCYFSVISLASDVYNPFIYFRF